MQRRYKLVVATVAMPRHYAAVAGRRKLPAKSVYFFDQPSLAGARSPNKPPPGTKSRFLDPQPRRSDLKPSLHNFSKTVRCLERVASLEGPPRTLRQVVSTDEDGWQDLEPVPAKHRTLSHRMGPLETPHTWKRQEDRALVEVLTTFKCFPPQSQIDLSNRQRVNGEVLDKLQASLQDLACSQEATNHELDQLRAQLKSQPALPGADFVERLRQVPGTFAQVLSSCWRHLITASDKSSPAPQRTPKQVLASIVVRTFFVGSAVCLSSLTKFVVAPLVPSTVDEFLHILSHLTSTLAELTALLWLSPSESTLGLAIYTSALPVLIAMAPGMKKAYNLVGRRSFWKHLFTASRRRLLSSSSRSQGPRKELAYRDLVNNHPELLDRPFPMAAVLNDLRNLQALRGPSSSREYKVAERRLYRVQHESDMGSGHLLTLRRVTQLLQPDDSVGWTVIRQRLLNDRVDAIDDLSEQDKARVLFQRVYGIGAVKAERFVEAGYLTLEQLKDAPLEKAQRIGLEHMDDIECLIPRPESEQWRELLLDIFHTVDAHLGAELLGSFRRGDYFSSDLDWVLYHPSVIDTHISHPSHPTKRTPNPTAAALLGSIIALLRQRNLLAAELLSHGPVSAKGLIRLPGGGKARRIDLNFAPYSRRAFYTLAKTGDADLMVHLRAKAKLKGWALNEYGIGPHNPNGSAWTQNLLNATDERQIFALLDIEYLEPEQRSFNVYAKKLNIIPP